MKMLDIRSDVMVDIGIAILVILASFLFMAIVAMGLHLLFDDAPGDNNVHEYTARGETHEYLIVDRGVEHLPNCKFCKAKGGK